MGVWIKADGSIKDVAPQNGTDYSLEELQSYVGGYIEAIPIGSRYVVCNEEGLLLKLNYNRKASVITGIPLVGDVLICRMDEIK